MVRALILALSAAALAGCDPCECANDCGRSYVIGTGPAQVSIANLHEGGKDCEIESIPLSIPSGLRTVIGTIERRDPTGKGAFSYTVAATESFAGDARAERCGRLPQFESTEALSAAELDPGDGVCVVGEVRSEVICTQRGCGY